MLEDKEKPKDGTDMGHCKYLSNVKSILIAQLRTTKLLVSRQKCTKS